VALNLGDINFGLGVDTSRLDRSTQAIINFGDRVERACKQTAEGAAQAAAALRRQEAAALSALQKTLNLNQAIRNAGAPTALIDSNAQAFQRLQRSMTAGELGALSFQRAQTGLAASLANSRRALNDYNNMAKVLDGLQGQKSPFFSQSQGGSAHLLSMKRAIEGFKELPTAKVSKFTELMKDLSSAATLTSGPLSGLGARVTALTQIFTRSNLATAGFIVGVAGIGYALFKASQGAVDTAIKLNVIQQRFTQMTGSSTEAALQLEHLRQVADKSGTSFLLVAEQFSKFQAAAAGSNLTSTEIAQTFDQVVQAAGGMHLSTQALESVLLALEQMMSKGVVSAEELRKQLGNALPGAFETAAKSMNLTTAEFDKLLKTGSVMTDEFLLKFAPAMLKAMNIDPDRKVQSLQSDLVRLGNSAIDVFIAFDKTFGTSRIFSVGVQALTGSLDLLAVSMDKIIAIAGAGAGALLTLLAPRLWQAAALGILAVRIAILSLSQTIATAGSIALAFSTLLGGPLVGALLRVGLALAGAYVGYRLFSSGAQTATDKAKELTTQLEEYLKARESLDKGNAGTTDTLLQRSAATIEGLRNEVAEINRLANAYQRSADAAKALGDVDTFSTFQTDANNLRAKAAETQKTLDALTAKYPLLLAELKEIQSVENAIADTTTDRAREAIEKIEREISANNRLGAAMRKSEEAGIRMRGILEDLKEQQQAGDALKDAGVGPERIAKALKDLEGSRASVVAGEIAQKFREIGREAGQITAVAKVMSENGELGEAFATTLEQEQAITNATRTLRLEMLAWTATEVQAASAVMELENALREQLAAQRALIAISAERDISRLEAEVNVMQKAATAGVLSSGALQALNREFSNQDAIRSHTEAVIRATNSQDAGAEAARRMADALKARDYLASSEALANVNLQITRLNLELATIPQGADAVGRLRAGFQIEDEIQAVTDMLVGMGYSLEFATGKAGELGTALHKVSDANNRLDGTRELLRGLGQIGENAFDKLIDGGSNFMDILTDLFNDITKLILKLMLVNPLLNQLTGATGTSALPTLSANLFGGGQGGFGALAGLGSLLGIGGGAASAAGDAFASMGGIDAALASGLKMGGAWSNGIRYAAKGMVLGGPTMFGSSGGPIMGGELGKNSEGLLPLKRMSDGNLGVISEPPGRSSRDVNVTNVWNIQTPNVGSFGYSQKQMEAQGQSAAFRVAQRLG